MVKFNHDKGVRWVPLKVKAHFEIHKNITVRLISIPPFSNNCSFFRSDVYLNPQSFFLTKCFLAARANISYYLVKLDGTLGKLFLQPHVT